MKSFSDYRKHRGGKIRKTRRKSRRPVSINSAKNILRDYYLKKNNYNKKKATRSIRKDIGSKSKKTLRSKSKRSYKYRPSKHTKGPSGPGLYDMVGLDNKHRDYKKKKSYRKYRKYRKKNPIEKLINNIFN